MLDYLQGGELFQYLRQQKRFPEETARFYAAEIFLALSHLHDKNIIYRDLKPENVLLDSEGHICLTDFGISKITAEDKFNVSIVGTPEYLSPELLMGEGYNYLADYWGFGILTYEMLVGTPPFT